MPPACAMAMARPASVTVSMADDSSGMLSRMDSRQLGHDFHLPRHHLGRAGNQQYIVERQGEPRIEHDRARGHDIVSGFSGERHVRAAGRACRWS